LENKLIGDWYGDNGYNLSGYLQIRNRLEYFLLEHNNLTLEEKNYEVRVVNELISLIPRNESRHIYRELQTKIYQEIYDGNRK